MAGTKTYANDRKFIGKPLGASRRRTPPLRKQPTLSYKLKSPALGPRRDG
jgi:hypothetical protein